LKHKDIEIALFERSFKFNNVEKTKKLKRKVFSADPKWRPADFIDTICQQNLSYKKLQVGERILGLPELPTRCSN
jgi:hypothetical protein